MDSIKPYVQVIFVELESDVGDVYKHTVSGARIGPLIEAVDGKLSVMVDLLVEELRDNLAIHLLQAIVDAFLRILLHGGSNRYDFKISSGI